MEQQPITSDERRRLSDELIAAAERGEQIDQEQLNPALTSIETVTTITRIRRAQGRIGIDMTRTAL